MWLIAKRLALGTTLIVAASAVLLLSDRGQRKHSKNGGVRKVASLIYASRPVLEDSEQGMLDALADAGFVDGKGMQLERFNAENDIANANVIAKEITSGRFYMVLTVSTPCLQAVANANRAGKAIHIFSAVTDPFGAGVGISRTDPLDHPEHLAGVGTFQPVKRTFQLARQFFPGLKTVGVVWNPAEACSEACTLIAREVCGELGITLLEAPVDNSAGVLEAAESLVARGVQALWIGGDNTVEMAINSMLRAAGKGHIPVFNNSPALIAKGTLFGLGASYYKVGRLGGKLAADVLNGTDPATIPIEDRVPELLAINQKALKGLRDPWRIPPDIVKTADTVVDEQGVEHAKEKTPVAPAPSAKPRWELAMVRYVDSPPAEDAEEAILEVLKKEGILERAKLKRFSAQCDIAILNGILDSLKGRDLDLLFVTSTPTLQAAIQRFDRLPVIFTTVADGVRAGAGETNEKHRPNVAGITTISAFEDMVTVLKECLPNVRKVGTLFVPAEVNSVFYKELMVKAMGRGGIEVVAVAVNSNSEVSEGALSLCGRDIDVICQISDNMTVACFPAIEQTARRCKKPIFSFQTSQARDGAVVALGRDYDQAGREAGELGVKVLRGAKPGDFPFRPVSGYTLVVNLKAAKEFGLKIPDTVVKRADEVVR